MQGFPDGSTPAKLVASAFPALQKLEIIDITLSYADISSLTACSQLSSLTLRTFQVQPIAGAGRSSPLSAVASLRQLSVHYTLSSIVAGLTQLHHLELRGAQFAVTLEEFRPILAACKQLTSLTLDYTLVQGPFDALLTHAPQLTSLTCSSLDLHEDRSASPCSLKELVFTRQGLDLITVANLPITGVTHLAFLSDELDLPDPAPTLDIWTSQFICESNIPDKIHRGLLNLTRCPAWQQCGPVVRVDLLSKHHHLSTKQLGLLMGALAPLSSKEVKLTIDMQEVVTGGPVIQQLGEALGSSLGHLVLVQCDLSDDLWPAVWAHLPGLEQLTVTDKVRGSIGPQQITSFCSQAVRPLKLNLGSRLYGQVQRRHQLERQWGLAQVTVAKLAGV
jgi:hypothetical protein